MASENSYHQKFCLRPIVDNDHAFLIDLHNDPEVLKNLTDPRPITLEHHLTWWNNVKNNPRQLRLIFTVDDVPVGLTKFYNIDETNKNLVLGADIHKSFRGKGYAKHMWIEMLNVCFHGMKMHRVSLTTAEYNIVAHRVYENLGFKVEGKMIQSLLRDGKFHDQICMYMLSTNWVKQ